MSFRPFSLGDALLLQRLRNYSTPLQIERILLESISPVRTALRSRFPWYRHSSFTYVLRQEENGLAREGLIQLRIRPHSHEADVTLLSPALDAPQGHPAIWQKLLTYSAQHIFRQNVCRLFSDLPDQPLLVNTFRQAGFVPLTQVTIWRLDSAPLAPSESTLRPQRAADAPELERLYQRITPVPVQRLEVGLAPNQPDEDRISPILSNPHHVHISGYVLDDDRGRGLAGCVQILWGKRGAWIRLWTDTNDPRTHNARLLLGFALQRIYEAPHFHRAYISVRAYQTGLNALLSDYGFGPSPTGCSWCAISCSGAAARLTRVCPRSKRCRRPCPARLPSPNLIPPTPSVGHLAALKQSAAGSLPAVAERIYEAPHLHQTSAYISVRRLPDRPQCPS